MSSTIIHTELHAEILDFCERTGTARSTFGKEALNDPSLIGDIEAGRELRRHTIAAIQDYMRRAGKVDAA